MASRPIQIQGALTKAGHASGFIIRVTDTFDLYDWVKAQVENGFAVTITSLQYI